MQVYGYSDGSLISQETMQDATASHLAKQIFPPHVTDVLRQWMRFHIMVSQNTALQILHSVGKYLIPSLNDARRSAH